MRPEPLLESIVQQFATSAANFLDQAVPLALLLFVNLATIQIAWDLMMWVLRDEVEIVGKAIRKFLVLSFFYLLIAGFPLWMPLILDSFEVLGQRVTGLEGLSPSSLFLQGVALAFALGAVWSKLLLTVVPFAQVLQVVIFFAVLIAFTILALRLTAILIEGSLVVGGLMFFLAGAGHKATFGLAEGYIRYGIDVGVRSFVIYLLVFVGRDLGTQWAVMVRDSGVLGAFDPTLHLGIPAAAVVYAYLVWTLPKTISSRLIEPLSFSGHNPLADH